MSKAEDIKGIRIDLQKEQDAIVTYDEQIGKSGDSRVKKVLTSIANEERVHVGELTKLLEILNGEEKYLEDGENEVIHTLNLPKRNEKCVANKKRKRKRYETFGLMR